MSSDDEMIRCLDPVAILQTLLDVRNKSTGQILRDLEIVVHLSLDLVDIAQDVVELS